MKKYLLMAMLVTATLWLGGAEAFAASDAGGDDNLLKPMLGQFAWQLILFLVLFVVLTIFVWPPILKGLQDREAKIKGDLSSAEKAAKDAAGTLEEYKAQLADAQKKAQEVIEEGRTAATKLSAELKTQAESEIQAMRERAGAEIRGAKEEALAQIYEQAAVMSTQVAGQILRKEISVDDQRGLIDASLQALKERN
ncbi:ATP synthase subunit b [Poriferisphaera corsica]|uniref:ATP synthase subunit b n=1 Tax=Poriferisphaera corsica TaxID=2528020 RepID=A0A517YRH8_9BACT|nr:F0F1 ATP synthase subunit B [Poriferisphaera corsica]QDU32836.1 ATP synthase subunit b [Poriferisphaera corsica]